MAEAFYLAISFCSTECV